MIFQVPVLQEKLYIGLEHAPPNFDVKNKIFGPMVSGYIHCMYLINHLCYNIPMFTCMEFNDHFVILPSLFFYIVIVSFL